MKEMKTCKDCYWYSDVTVKSCDKEHEPCNPDNPACSLFEEAKQEEQK